MHFTGLWTTQLQLPVRRHLSLAPMLFLTNAVAVLAILESQQPCPESKAGSRSARPWAFQRPSMSLSSQSRYSAVNPSTRPRNP